jgi:nucleotide-binding universal stress UspA family protein
MFRRVVVGVDGRPGGRDAIALGNALAAPDAVTSLVGVFALTPGGVVGYDLGLDDAPTDEAKAKTVLEAQRDATGSHAGLITERAGSVGRGLHDVAQQQRADLLVVGSSHRAFPGRVLGGGQTRAVLHGAPCAVAIAPLHYADTDHVLNTVGVAFNSTPDSEAALAVAREIAAAHGARIRARCVVEVPSGPYGFGGGLVLRDVLSDMLAAERKRMAALDGVDGDAVIGLAGEELSAFSAEVDLLVSGSRGYGPAHSLIAGSTSLHLAGHARCPLVVIPRALDSG